MDDTSDSALCNFVISHHVDPDVRVLRTNHTDTHDVSHGTVELRVLPDEGPIDNPMTQSTDPESNSQSHSMDMSATASTYQTAASEPTAAPPTLIPAYSFYCVPCSRTYKLVERYTHLAGKTHRANVATQSTQEKTGGSAVHSTQLPATPATTVRAATSEKRVLPFYCTICKLHIHDVVAHRLTKAHFIIADRIASKEPGYKPPAGRFYCEVCEKSCDLTKREYHEACAWSCSVCGLKMHSDVKKAHLEGAKHLKNMSTSNETVTE